MKYIYQPKGVCSRQMEVELAEKDGKKIIDNVRIIGGCAGNSQGVARLIAGMEVEDAIGRIEGIRCGMKSTSCPDQLSIALREALTHMD